MDISVLVTVWLIGVFAALSRPRASANLEEWTIYIAHDACSDYTRGFDEKQTRNAMADVVAAHLDLMRKTDHEALVNRDRYNMAVTQEALCFIEHYPERRQELAQRIREGRAFLSPFLCMSLWGSQSTEGLIRTLCPARRLEREWDIPLEVAEHLEEPSLPWGMAPILSGCGIRWLSVPFFAYDSTFSDLQNPSLFILEGPDGSQLRVIMDSWACCWGGYCQGRKLLWDPGLITGEWIPHYRELGQRYRLRATLASGGHGDTAPWSGGQAAGRAELIRRYNDSAGPHPTIANAALPQFCKVLDDAQEGPFLPTIRGCFGHSWEVWPVSLARYTAEMRENERTFLAAESLLALGCEHAALLCEVTGEARERAEWCWAMLSDHAWNGPGDDNRKVNAGLRRRWCQEWSSINEELVPLAWTGLGLRPSATEITVFNPLSIPRCGVIGVSAPARLVGMKDGSAHLRTQIVEEDGGRALYFESPRVPGFGLKTLALTSAGLAPTATGSLAATETSLDSPYYSVRLDPNTGLVSSLIRKATGTELTRQGASAGVCTTTYFWGVDQPLTHSSSEVMAVGVVLARVRTRGAAGDVRVTTDVTVYAGLDQVDFDVRLHKPTLTREERVCQVFPMLDGRGTLRVETPGAIIVPRRQPEGDLLPGADTRRLAVQGFVDVHAGDEVGVLIAPIDSFVLRLDLGDLAFECLGNDQNHAEVTKDQDGMTDFRFRYSLAPYAGPYDNARAANWSRKVSRPFAVARGDLPHPDGPPTPPRLDPSRGIATCWKPADDSSVGGTILRLWEVAGRSGPVTIEVGDSSRVLQTDLLERDGEELSVVDDRVTLDLASFGFGAVRLVS